MELTHLLSQNDPHLLAWTSHSSWDKKTQPPRLYYHCQPNHPFPTTANHYTNHKKSKPIHHSRFTHTTTTTTFNTTTDYPIKPINSKCKNQAQKAQPNLNTNHKPKWEKQMWRKNEWKREKNKLREESVWKERIN